VSDPHDPSIAATHLAPSVYSEQGLWPERTLGSYLRQTASDSPHALAVVDGDSRISYGELYERARSIAHALKTIGVGRGDVITIDLPNWCEALVAVQATLWLGAVANPIIPIYREREVGFILDQARPKVVIVPHRFRSIDYVEMVGGLVDPAAECRVVVTRPQGDIPDDCISFEALLELGRHGGPQCSEAASADDIALLMYTSGTTADPKGVLHNHRTLGYENASITDLFRLRSDDTVFTASPVTHITGFLYGVLLPPMLGVTSVLLDVWEPEIALGLIESERCRFTVAATPFLRGLTEAYDKRRSPSALRAFLCGGADVPPELVYRAREVMETAVVRVYGSTEFPTFSCGGPDDAPAVGAETDGLPIGPVEFFLDETDDSGTGELLVKGPDLFLGYLDASLNSEAFTESGFFRTGDLASVDQNGAVTIRGRKKDIIIRNGENLSAKEIEDLLHEHPKVHEVAIVAMPDANTGEKVCAFVVGVPGAEIILDELCDHLKSRRVARQKLPEWLEVVDSLPTTASGKVQKFALRDRARQIAKVSAEATARSSG
jgi:acyl-CoA synthetase (AMP-forming)/AMP-acid ligase II